MIVNNYKIGSRPAAEWKKQRKTGHTTYVMENYRITIMRLSLINRPDLHPKEAIGGPDPSFDSSVLTGQPGREKW